VSHIFDTGLMLPQRTILRRGAVALLSALKRSNGGYLADVIGFGGIVRSYTDDDGISQLMRQFGRTPCIGVQCATREYQTAALGGKQAMSELELLLYFATQHSRDLLSGRQESDVRVEFGDNSADPGLDVMMEHAVELMHGAYPTMLTGTVKQIQIRREQELATDEKMTIWLQTYRVVLQSYTGGREWRTPEQLLESIGWRTTTDPAEVLPPDPQEAPTSVDVNTDPKP